MPISSLTENLKKDPKFLKNKRVLLRVDLNEEVNDKGKLLDNFRIQAILPTVKLLQKSGVKIIIASHLGRPDGKWPKGKEMDEFSLHPVADCLSKFLEYKFVETDAKLPTYPISHVVLFKKNLTEPETHKLLEAQSPQDIVMLENIRFYEGEDSNTEEFSKHLAGLADFYVNDAFSVCHRAAASVVGVTKHLPSFAGPLLEKEIKAMDYILSPAIRKPFILVMGGIKIVDKEKTLRNLGKRADKILLAGGLANLFLSGQGYDIGKNGLDNQSLALAKEMLLNFKAKLVLPSDVAVETIKTPDKAKAKKITEVVSTDKLYDIGPQTILAFSKILKSAGTICWNGPMGYFEKKPFRAGTMALAKVIGGVGSRSSYAMAGGGETVASIRQAGQMEHFDHVSTGGGAMLEYLAGSKLPGIEALRK